MANTYRPLIFPRKQIGGEARYTLICLDTEYDQDSGENLFTATFHQDCEKAFTERVSMDRFKTLLGKLGRKFTKDMQEVV
jgi:hypothetical protein